MKTNNFETLIMANETNLKNIKVGQIVKIDIAVEGEYVGTVDLISSDRNRIHLVDVTFCQTKQKFSGIRKFYLPEIQSIKVVSDVQNDEKDETPELVDDPIKFEINSKENEAIQRLITNRCTIKTVGEEFDNALDDIFQHEFVGLNAGGVENGRHGEITLIVLTTPRRIYSFNIKAIGAVDSRLKKLFESTITKVIHGASVLADNLWHCHGINLKKVFDTMVVHKLLGFSTTLRQSITERTYLPTDRVEKFDCNDESTVGRAAILLKFHDFLTEQLLKNAYQSFNENLNYTRNKDTVEVQMMYRNDKTIVKRLNEIRPFKLNL